MWYRLDLRVRADVDDEALHEIGVLANTYAVVDEMLATRDPESGDPRFIARIDAPSAEAALGALLTVISQTSGHAGRHTLARMQRRTIGRGLGAVLFTDIVGSTAVAAEIGNTRWSELVSRHHRLIRGELRRFGGREQDTAGDGFFATFERPVDAIRCAFAAAEAVRAIGIEIRAGVSFGQLELVEGKAGGLIVNTAARVMSVAGAGEVLVPAAVKDLVPGTGISFDDHGTHHLKGIEGDIRLFRVTEVDGRTPAEPLGAEEAAERRASIVPATNRRAGIVVGGLAAAAVAVVVGVWAFAGDDPNPPGAPASP
ncbi:MAG: Adenylyl cyclase, partial [Actinomycetia bacterium]|nr:Adenylyl cyclase [Actinomycetes bacterium]